MSTKNKSPKIMKLKDLLIMDPKCFFIKNKRMSATAPRRKTITCNPPTCTKKSGRELIEVAYKIPISVRTTNKMNGQ